MDWGKIAGISALVGMLGMVIGGVWVVVVVIGDHRAEHAEVRRELAVAKEARVLLKAEHDRAVTFMSDHIVGHDARMQALLAPVLPPRRATRDHMSPW